MISHLSLRRVVLPLVLGVAGAAVLTATAAAGPGAGRPVLTDPAACANVPNFTCSWLTVPLARSRHGHGRHDPATLRLQVAAADNVDAPRGVLMILTGGPGQPGVALAPRLATRFAAYANDYRLVFIDQRGTGAGAIDCPALQNEVGDSDVLAPTADAVTECASLLGDSRNFYTTADTVADLDDLRQALGVRRWTVDGVSYGTFVAERYALTYPNRASRVVLDSVVPQEGAPALYADTMHRSGLVLREACAEQNCGFDPAADLNAVIRRDGDDVGVLNVLIIASIFDPKFTGHGFYPMLALLHQAATGDPGPLNQVVQQLGSGAGSSPSTDLSAGLHAATACADLRDEPWGSTAAPLAGRDAAVARTEAAVDPAQVWPFLPRTTVAQGLVATCRYWPPSRPDPRPRTNRITVPVLVLAGDRDLSTPLPWAQAEAARIPHSHLVIVPGMGHAIQGRNPIGDAAVQDFLLN
jgi:pimeloyl-ACP methyl ester carboxylesterase